MAYAAPLDRVVTPSDVSRHAWRALVTRCAPSDPKLLPEVAVDAAARGQPLLYWRTDGAGASLAVLERRRLRLARAPGIGRLTTIDALRVVGNDVFGDVDGPSAAQFVDAMCALLERGRADGVLFDDLAVDSPLAGPIAAAQAARRVAVYRPSPPQAHWYIEFPSPPDRYWKSVSSKTRYKLRRKARAFEHHLLRVTERRDVAAFLDKARAISERSWQGKRLGPRIRGAADEARRAERLADAGALRSYLLEAPDGTPLAFVLGSQWRGRYLHEETGYDMSRAELSPGIVLQYRMLEDLVAHDTPDILDFGAGDAEYKRSLANVRGDSGRLVMLRRAPGPRIARGVAAAYGASEARARAILRRAGFYERARRVYRGRT